MKSIFEVVHDQTALKMWNDLRLDPSIYEEQEAGVILNEIIFNG